MDTFNSDNITCPWDGTAFQGGEQGMKCSSCGAVMKLDSWQEKLSCRGCNGREAVRVRAVSSSGRTPARRMGTGLNPSSGVRFGSRTTVNRGENTSYDTPVNQRNENQRIGVSSPRSSSGTPTRNPSSSTLNPSSTSNGIPGCLIGAVSILVMLISSFFVFPAFLTHANKAKQSEAKPNSSPKEEVRSQTNSSAPSNSTEQVNFDKGSTGATISNSVKTNQRKRYLLNCGSGQLMTVQIRQGDVNVAIIAPNGQTIGNAVNGGTKWNGQLPSDGDYIIEVSAPNQSDYTINIEVLPSKNTPVSSTPATNTPVSSTPKQTLKDFYELTVKDNKAAGKKFTTDNFRNKYRSTSSDDQKTFVSNFNSIEVTRMEPIDKSPTKPKITVWLRYSPKDRSPQRCGYRDFTFVLNNNNYLIDNDGEEIYMPCN